MLVIIKHLVKDVFRMRTAFCLLGNNEEIYAQLSSGPLGCVETGIFEDGSQGT